MVKSVLSVLESEPSSAQLIEMVFSRYSMLEYSGLIKNHYHAFSMCYQDLLPIDIRMVAPVLPLMIKKGTLM